MPHLEPEILFEGPCAYAVKQRDGYRICVASANWVRHVEAGIAGSAEQAERVCKRLNAYPHQTRRACGLDGRK